MLCTGYRAQRLMVFSCCNRHGFCRSYGARQMVKSAALLVDEVLARLAMR